MNEPPQEYRQKYEPHGTGQVGYGSPQPQQQHNTTVIINQPASMQNDRIIGTVGGHRGWSSGLFSCFDDIGKCMWALCCPCCVLADVSSRLGECICVTCCVPGGLVTVRTRVRTLGGIQGSICQDYLATACCEPCVMCQVHRELDYMGL